MPFCFTNISAQLYQYTHPAVNFINILRTNFSYICRFSTYMQLRKAADMTFVQKNARKKRWWNWQQKSNPTFTLYTLCQATNRKSYIVNLMSQKLHKECWWNWLEKGDWDQGLGSISPTFYEQLLLEQITKALKDTNDLTVFFLHFGDLRK